MEQITIEQLPFKFGLLKSMSKDNLVIEKMETEGLKSTYYYLTSSKVHRVYLYRDGKELLLTEIYLPDLFKALEHPGFSKSISEYLGN